MTKDSMRRFRMRMPFLFFCAVFAAADQSTPAASQAIDVNNSGMIVGIRNGVPALWQRRNFIGNLPLLNGAAAVPARINNNGDVVGYSGGKPNLFNQGEHAVLWRGGRIYDLGTLPGDFSSRAVGINDAGVIVGISCSSNNVCQSVMWTNLVIASAGMFPPTFGGALDINNKGQILRTASVDLGSPFGVEGGFAILGSLSGKPVSTLMLFSGGLNGFAQMNDHAEIIANGNRACGHETDGVFWNDGTWSCFGNINAVQPGGCPTTPSFSTAATGLNNRGDIVGWIETPRGIAAQLEDANGKVTVLPPLTPCGVAFPAAINDSRLIVGTVFSGPVAGTPLQAVLWNEGEMIETLK
jgi:probable HAF family extracellular repeat protein